jgi:CPA1 family monovalent cation:H+ antiporter
LILFLSFCVILVTLVLQGLTLPSVIRVLGLAGEEGVDPEEKEARRIVFQAAIEYLERERLVCGEEHSHVFNDLLDRYRHKLEHVAEGHDENGENVHIYKHLLEVSEGAVQAERKALLQLQEEGRISDDVVRTIERELDLEDSRYRAVRI